jgi:hypothetical protein
LFPASAATHGARNLLIHIGFQHCFIFKQSGEVLDFAGLAGHWRMVFNKVIHSFCGAPPEPFQINNLRAFSQVKSKNGG